VTGVAPQLAYAVATEPFPIQAGGVATISVVATNPSPDPDGNPVQIEGVEVALPIGDGGSALTADATGIDAVPPSDAWRLQAGTAAGVFAFVPVAGGSVAVGAESLVFALQGVSVNSQPGYVDGFRVLEEHGGSAALPLTKFPAGWGSVDFWVDPADVASGQSTTLNWDGPAGATYTIEYAAGGSVVNVPGPGQPALANAGAYPGASDPPLDVQQTTVFTLQVSLTEGDDQYATQAQKTVTVVPHPAITEFKGSLEAGATRPALHASWRTTDADYCTLGSDATELAPAGSRSVELSPPWIGGLELHAVNRRAAAPASARLDIAWRTATSATTEYAGYPRLTPDGALLYTSGPYGIVQFQVPPPPSAELQQQFVCDLVDPALSGEAGVGSIAAAAPPAPAGSLWVLTWTASPSGSSTTLELVSFSAGGTPTTLVSQPIGAQAIGTMAELAATPDGSAVYVWDGSGTLFGFAVGAGPSLTLAGSANAASLVSALAAGADGTLYVGAGGDVGGQGVYSFAATPSDPLGGAGPGVELPYPSPYDLSIAGDLLFSTNAEEIVCIDCTTMQPVGPPLRVSAAGLAAAPDGRRLFCTLGEPASVAVVVPRSVSGGVPPGGG
jgi:hypothetical protein